MARLTPHARPSFPSFIHSGAGDFGEGAGVVVQTAVHSGYIAGREHGFSTKGQRGAVPQLQQNMLVPWGSGNYLAGYSGGLAVIGGASLDSPLDSPQFDLPLAVPMRLLPWAGSIAVSGEYETARSFVSAMLEQFLQVAAGAAFSELSQDYEAVPHSKRVTIPVTVLLKGRADVLPFPDPDE